MPRAPEFPSGSDPTLVLLTGWARPLRGGMALNSTWHKRPTGQQGGGSKLTPPPPPGGRYGLILAYCQLHLAALIQARIMWRCAHKCAKSQLSLCACPSQLLHDGRGALLRLALACRAFRRRGLGLALPFRLWHQGRSLSVRRGGGICPRAPLQVWAMRFARGAVLPRTRSHQRYTQLRDGVD